jgi:dihydroorotase
MTELLDLVIRGGTCVSHRGVGAADIGIRDGRIVAFGDVSGFRAQEELDARGLHVRRRVIEANTQIVIPLVFTYEV